MTAVQIVTGDAKARNHHTQRWSAMYCLAMPHDLNPQMKNQHRSNATWYSPKANRWMPRVSYQNLRIIQLVAEAYAPVQGGKSESLKEDSWSLDTCFGGLGPCTWRDSQWQLSDLTTCDVMMTWWSSRKACRLFLLCDTILAENPYS